MIEFNGEMLTVFAMYDEHGDPVDDRSKAREFDVVREDCKIARLRLPHPETHLTKIQRQ